MERGKETKIKAETKSSPTSPHRERGRLDRNAETIKGT